MAEIQSARLFDRATYRDFQLERRRRAVISHPREPLSLGVYIVECPNRAGGLPGSADGISSVADGSQDDVAYEGQHGQATGYTEDR